MEISTDRDSYADLCLHTDKYMYKQIDQLEAATSYNASVAHCALRLLSIVCVLFTDR